LGLLLRLTDAALLVLVFGLKCSASFGIPAFRAGLRRFFLVCDRGLLVRNALALLVNSVAR